MDPDGPAAETNRAAPTDEPNATYADPPGLRAQIGATVAAVKRLIRAHLDLARAELADVVDEVKRMVALFGAAIGAVVLFGLLFLIGGLLFLGEWLFGSIGWGVLLGGFLLLDIAAVAILAALDAGTGRIGRAFVAAFVVGIVVGLVFGFDLTHRGWVSVGEQVLPSVDPGLRPVLVAVATLATIFGLLGFVLGGRSGLGAAIGSLIAGAVLGAVVGVLTGISLPPTVGAALGVLVGLITWPLIAGRDLARKGIDGEAMKQRFTPSQTMELTRETIEWVRARMPLVPKS
ncbi:MAG TPA: hypothetical protein VK831_05900 [Candidatus Deferrimicrobiaceae bacterium]|nr:hypothetical protein [Candidatus Deferrimicrobiaceae bacterium]